MKRIELLPGRERSLRQSIQQNYRSDEASQVRRLLRHAAPTRGAERKIAQRARSLITQLRARKTGHDNLETFLQEYDLSSQEGLVLLGLAEALLRIPDASSVDALIQDKLEAANWSPHLGHSDSLLVNAATWGLMLTGRVLHKTADAGVLQATLKNLLARTGEPLIRDSIHQAVNLAGHHFVCGETLPQALESAQPMLAAGYRYSFDMLGEAALTGPDADRYLQAYAKAIRSLGKTAKAEDCLANHGISVKLSALHPRFEPMQRERILAELPARLLQLAELARARNLSLTVDAEESERLELTLEVFTRVFRDPRLAGWDGLGLAVQAYQKRAPYVIDYLGELARDRGQRIPVRLVKGAYWDTEIKQAQQQALAGYPVFTNKAHTDISYLACVRRLFKSRDALYPQFATHNAYTLATIMELAPPDARFECQRLHGMGADLYAPLVADGLPCRIYAPVGNYRDLLPYLVRRLLENGANTAFVRQLRDKNIAISQLTANPLEATRSSKYAPHPNIPLPTQLHGQSRRCGAGLDLSNPRHVSRMTRAAAMLAPMVASARLTEDEASSAAPQPVTAPANRKHNIGQYYPSTVSQIHGAARQARQFSASWASHSLGERVQCLERMAQRLHSDRLRLIALLVNEAGKTLASADAEVREAIDFCHYYAMRARNDLPPQTLQGPTGEHNLLSLQGLGVVACISPWNFPLAIFVGQVAAALVSGNCVLAKPAVQTPLVAAHVTALFHKAGIPPQALQLLPGDAAVGAELTACSELDAVLFTGSLATARRIQEQLATRPGLPIRFIAETGGINAMVVDSTAHLEQAVPDILRSAFDSAGQRCSALRLLYVQDDIAKPLLSLLAGAIQELVVGDPARPETDIGPLIDAHAKARIQRHLRKLDKQAELIARSPLGHSAKAGHYLAPCAYELKEAGDLTREIFGPVLHVVRYAAAEFDSVIEQINASGYGLTFGLHSRLESRARQVQAQVHAGNIYINRDMIGALVGVQPFGGCGNSGTGPKAGGPNLLLHLVTEKLTSTNTAAMGGNASLLCLT